MTNTPKNNNTWIERFGTLDDVTPRESAKGPYVTFLINCGTFNQIGAAFGAEAVAFLRASVGKRVWVKGPLEARSVTKDGETKEVNAFKAIYFKELEASETKEEVSEEA
jgi:hypothetical protein